MLKPPKPRPGRLYPRRLKWRKARLTARRWYCEVCKNATFKVSGGKIRNLGICHHIVSERWVRKFAKGCDPHDGNNLAWLCKFCHGRVAAAEPYLFTGNRLEFLRIHRVIGFPMERGEKALGFYGC